MHYRIGLDLGSHTIRAAAAEIKKDGSLSLVGIFRTPSSGIRRGTIEQQTAVTQSLSTIISQLKPLVRGDLKHMIAATGGADLHVQSSRGVVAVSRADDEIYQDDINRVLQSAQAVSLPANRIVLETIVRDFVVDGITGIQDPLGMIGKRLEVNMLLLQAFAPSIRSIERCVETLGGGLDRCVVGPLAAARAVLSPSQKEQGVLLIDIGSGKTSIAIFEEDRLIHAAIIPMGGGTITNDIAIGLRVPIEIAEIVKLTYGSALAKEVSSRDAIELNKIDPRVRGTVTKKFIAEIIEDRLAEIFELVNTEVKRVGKVSRLPAGAILVGGGAKLPLVAELARQELKISAQIGTSRPGGIIAATSELALQAEDPELATVLGLIEYSSATHPGSGATKGQLGATVAKIFKYFIP